MSLSITVDEAQANLKEPIHRLDPGEEVIITENQNPVAKLVGEPPKTIESPRPIPGRGKGTLVIHIEDEEHLDDFKEYLP